jgi:hypothetical protein
MIKHSRQTTHTFCIGWGERFTPIPVQSNSDLPVLVHLIVVSIGLYGVGMREEEMMCYDPGFGRGISLRTSISIGTSSGGKNSHAVAMAADDVGFIECDPMLYTVSEGSETDAGVSFVVGDDVTREEAEVAVF